MTREYLGESHRRLQGAREQAGLIFFAFPIDNKIFFICLFITEAIDTAIAVGFSGTAVKISTLHCNYHFKGTLKSL